MAIKPVTYQGVFNFKSNLYALEVKSRFIDQTNANGYYKGYGNELAAAAVNNVISVGSGAFVVQSRMNEIEGNETVEVTIENGKVGYLCAHIETYHPTDTDNCTLVIKTGATLGAITLIQEDVYSAAAETTNKIYEVPLYSFAMSGGAITNLTKVIKPIEDYATVKALADAAVLSANAAVTTANAANTNANTAIQKAAESNALAVLMTADKNTIIAAVAQLSEQIGEQQGTTVIKDGVAQATFDADNIIAALAAYASVALDYDVGGNIAAGFDKIRLKFATLKALAYKDKVALGDFVAGAIKNADIASDALISQSKIDGLITALANKITAAAGAITNADVSPSAAISQSKIEGLVAALAEKISVNNFNNANQTAFGNYIVEKKSLLYTGAAFIPIATNSNLTLLNAIANGDILEVRCTIQTFNSGTLLSAIGRVSINDYSHKSGIYIPLFDNAANSKSVGMIAVKFTYVNSTTLSVRLGNQAFVNNSTPSIAYETDLAAWAVKIDKIYKVFD